MPEVKTGKLLENATAAGPGGTAGPTSVGQKSVTAHVQGTGAVAATVKIEVSNAPTLASSWVAAATITLSGTTTAVDAALISAEKWAYYRANCTAISGTGATLNVVMGE
jgi:hypothetical protein